MDKEAAAKWGKAIAKRTGKELECWRNALVGCMAGMFVGGTYGGVNGVMDVAKQTPRPAPAAMMRYTLKAAGRTGLVCAAFFSTYHTLLCSARYMQWNKENDMYNVIGATALPALPLIVKARPQMAVCGMLVLLDNFTAQQMFNAMQGRGDEDDDEYEYVDDDEEEDW